MITLTLFDELVRRFCSSEPLDMYIEESSDLSKVTQTDVLDAGVLCWLSLTSWQTGDRNYSMVQVWPRKPEKEKWLIGAPEPLLTIRDFPRGFSIHSAGDEKERNVSLSLISSLPLVRGLGMENLRFLWTVIQMACSSLGGSIYPLPLDCDKYGCSPFQHSDRCPKWVLPL